MRFATLLLALLACLAARAQQLPRLDSVHMLLTDPTIEMEATFGLDNMYNFKFDVAEGQFRWLKKKYPQHPLPSFLMGLSNWWKIVPDVDNTRYDAVFLAYMDSTIYYAEQLEKDPASALEGKFFLAAGHAFKSRLYSERTKWSKAAMSGKRALKYLEACRNKGYLSPELLFGDALYNYYSVWIPENYPALKPVLIFFDKGDKEEGIRQLEQVCQEAFYTRIEAYMYLMRIYSVEENQNDKAMFIADYLHKQYPRNPYFHRFYARMLFTTGRNKELAETSQLILNRLDSGWVGYEATSGRYAAYYLGYLNHWQGKQEKAMEYYRKAIEYADALNAHSSGYYLSAVSSLAEYHNKRQEYDRAKVYYDLLLKHSDKKKKYYDEARDFQKQHKKRQRAGG